METRYICIENPATTLETVECAIQIRLEDRGARNATHFILVIDISESMADRDKLENVKHSANLVLNFLGPADRLSLITFGNTAQVYCSAVQCTPSEKSTIEGILKTIEADGCTNLSAGLLSVKDVVANSDASIKTGVLLLTDGHANRGIYNSAGILEILSSIHRSLPAVSFNFVAYGTEHNSELLKAMAETIQGAYSIVEGTEGAATVIGNTLGGLFSCTAQMVTLTLPTGSTVQDQYRLANISGQSVLELGDLYDGSETIVLAKIPKALVGVPIVLKGVSLPSLDRFEKTIDATPWSASVAIPPDIQALCVSVELTRLRYKCSNLFKKVRFLHSGDVRGIAEIKREIEEFKAAVANEAYTGPIIEMLREECASLEEAFRVIQLSPYHRPELMARIVQHEAFTSLGRGATQPLSAHDPEDHDDDMDPMHQAHENTVNTSVTSPYSSRMQRSVTNLMRTMSIRPEANAAVAAAAALSQAPP